MTVALVPFDGGDGLNWFSGAMVPWWDAKIHAFSHSLHDALCVFDAERVYRGIIFMLRVHVMQ